MRAIVAIGGGEIRAKSTLGIDKEIIRLSGKKHPRLLFIPTASSDSVGYWEGIQKYFGNHLSCRTDVLFLIREKPTVASIKQKIAAADIIYVGGGNTLRMIRVWRRLGVDRLLLSAYKQGTVLCGISAGSICWFESGHSDSLSFNSPKKWQYIKVKGLGFIKGIHCPHYNGKSKGVPRKEHFQKMIRKIGGMGIAIENNCAIEVLDGSFYRVISSKSRASAYKVYKKDGIIISEKIRQSNELTHLDCMYTKVSN